MFQVKGLYKGVTYPLLGQAAINAVLFGVESMVYTRLQNGNSTLNVKNSVIAGLCAGTAQTVIVCPMELVKIRMQNQSIGQQHASWAERKLSALSINGNKDRHRNLFQNYRGPIQTTRDIIHKEGVRGMFKGWWITLFREVPQFGIYFGTYAWLRLQLSQLTGTPPEELGAHYLSLAGGVTGVLTWCWYPVDVIKARIQNDGAGVKGERRKYSGVMDCVRKSVRSEGLRVLFKGIQPSLVRGFFNGFATFPVFTVVSQFLNGANNYHYY
jgi:solute carrier family 25 carnitine/acylcarnitine transporter 20/29